MFAKAAPVLNHPAVATAGRGLAVLGSVADAKSGYDAIAQGAAASNKRMDDAYHRGGDSYLSPEYLKTLGKETLGQTYAGVRAMPLVGSVVRGAEGLQDWLTGKNKPAPAASNEPITYDEATHSFSRAPTNMAEYEQMQKAREQAQAGLPRMNFSANGRDVSLTPSEVNAAAAVPLEGGGTMRDAIMNVGYRTNPNTNIRVGDGSGAGAGAAAPGGNAPSREQQRVEAYLDMAKRRHLPVSAANAGLDYESQMRGLEAQQPLRDAQADYYRTPKPVKGNDQIATGLNKLLQQSQSVELALMSPELQRDPQRYKQAQLFAKYLKDQIVAYQQSLRGDPYQPDTRSIVNNLPE